MKLESRMKIFVVVVLVLLLSLPFSLAQSVSVEKDYQMRTLHSYAKNYGISSYSFVKESDELYLSCLKVIALARSSFPKDSPDFQRLVEEIKSKQLKDGSFPPIITDDYPKEEGEWFYWEKSKAAGTALALLALLEAGESPNSEVVTKGIKFLLANKTEDYWTSTVYMDWEKTGIKRIGEFSSLVATAYATALLHKLGYNVTDSWEWVRVNLNAKNLTRNYSFGNFFTGFLFPQPYRDFRMPYESLTLPLLYLTEEGFKVDNEPLEFLISLFKQSQYSENATLLFTFYENYTTNYELKILRFSLTKGGTWEKERMVQGVTDDKIKLPINQKEGIVVLKVEGLRKINFQKSGVFLDLQIIKRGMKIYAELPVNYIDFRSYVNSQIVQFSESNETYYIIFLPELDGSWNHDVYSTSIALIWLYLAGETDYNGFKKGIEFLLRNDRSLDFDGYAYALIALSLYGGEWEKSKPEINAIVSNEEESIKYSAYILAIIMIFSIGYFWRKRK
ncbi:MULTISPECIES: hypothetical protein [Thermococcus]|nr:MULTISPECIES: hypothetical protein [Thermococcus]KUK17388.1 MAG: Uncharacterized protein XD54_1325 [Thermococcus sibiricus]KUK29253.1 MAG: Uncharacterized protein XD61_0254 [Thermococcus sp. 40_45]MBC7095273.1 hypothetical protein [Thermococcus sp.]HII68060.1 hypothetical protein [Thermococcaceae archaeon]